MHPKQVKHVVTKDYFRILDRIVDPLVAEYMGLKVGWWVLQHVEGGDPLFISPVQSVTEYEGF